MQEKTLLPRQGSDRVTIGESRSNTFILSGQAVPRSHELFNKEGEGYELRPIEGMTGQINLQGREIPLPERIGQTISVVPEDWGVIHYQGVTLFFQFVDSDIAIHKAGVISGIDATLAIALWFSFLIQVAFVFFCRVMWDEELASQAYELDERFVEMIAAAPPDELLEQPEDELAMDEETSERAPGEEGEFGEEDEEGDSILPDHDGPLVDQLDSTELGRAFDQAISQSGALSRMFDSSSFMAGFGQDFATAGEGDAYIVGRGSGGLGFRGTGRGGGGGRGGFGRVHGVGDIDTGGGRGVSARMGRRGQRAPRARVDRGEASVSGFLSREEIERVVRRHARGIRYCYERELQNDPTLEGQITANWTIDLDGNVSRRSIESNTMGNRDVESCLLREIGRMRFPEPDGGMVIVRYPFTFRGVTE
ncbi:MAG: AgmX/PglI C-terminal domain-containing protein [Bradymonadales bacterium]|nr:AgmX/PglI C-terminal domain-containing protein [Bradymonadales bacterium]